MVEVGGVKWLISRALGLFLGQPSIITDINASVCECFICSLLYLLFYFGLVVCNGSECANTPAPKVSAPIKNLCSKILGTLKDTQKVSK